MQGVSLGPAPKTLPAAGALATTKLEDWVKDLAGGKASVVWKDGALQFDVALAARDSKSAKVIAERLESRRKQLIDGGGRNDGSASFRVNGEEIKYQASLAPLDLVDAVSRTSATGGSK